MNLVRFFYTFCLLLMYWHVCSTWAEAPKTAKIAFTSAGDVNREIYLMNQMEANKSI